MCKHQPKLWAMRRTRTRSWAYSRWSLYAYVVFVEFMHFISPATGRNCVLVKMPPDGLSSHSCVSMSTSYSHVARLETERCCGSTCGAEIRRLEDRHLGRRHRSDQRG